MNRIDELLLEIEGKIGYADSTGNQQSKSELLKAKRVLQCLKNSEEHESLCNTCDRGNIGCCFQQPNIVIERKVIICSSYKGTKNEV